MRAKPLLLGIVLCLVLVGGCLILFGGCNVVLECRPGVFVPQEVPASVTDSVRCKN